AHRRRGVAGAASQVEHGAGHPVLEVVERLQQPAFDLALQRSRRVVAGRRARERAPHLARVEQRVPAAGVHAGSSCMKVSRRAATSSAWVRNGAWPPCSMTACVAFGVASAAARIALGSTRRSRRPAIQVLGTDSAGNLSRDRKSTRLNSSHVKISYAVFCLKKKRTT